MEGPKQVIRNIGISLIKPALYIAIVINALK